MDQIGYTPIGLESPTIGALIFGRDFTTFIQVGK
jgi:hypothetical protein